MAKPKGKVAHFKDADANFFETGNPRKTRLTVFRRANLLHKNYGAAVYLLVRVQGKYWVYSSAPKPEPHGPQQEPSADLEADNERLRYLVQDLQAQLSQEQNSNVATHTSGTTPGNVETSAEPQPPSFPPSLSYIHREIPAPDREIWYHEDVKDVLYDMQFLSFPRKATHAQHDEAQPSVDAFEPVETATGSAQDHASPFVQPIASSDVPDAGMQDQFEHGAGQASTMQEASGSPRYDPDHALTWPELDSTEREEEDDDDLVELAWIPWNATDNTGDHLQVEDLHEEQASEQADSMDLSSDEMGSPIQSAESDFVDGEDIAEQDIFREDVSSGPRTPKVHSPMITPRTSRSYRSGYRCRSRYRGFRNPHTVFMRELSVSRSISPNAIATDKVGPYLSPTQTTPDTPSTPLCPQTPGSPTSGPPPPTGETRSRHMAAQDTSSTPSPPEASAEKIEYFSPSHRRVNFVIRWEDISKPQGSIVMKPDRGKLMIRRSPRLKKGHA